MRRKKLLCCLVLLACFCVTSLGCQAAVDSVEETDRWLDEELHKHM